MTRAKRELFLLGAAAPGSTGSFSEFLARVGGWPAKEDLQSLGSFRPHERLFLGSEAHDLSQTRHEAGAGASEVRGEAALDGKKLGRLWRGRFEEGNRSGASHVFTSPTSYLKEGPKTALLEESVVAFRPSRSWESAALAGEVCHRVLERWDFSGGGSLSAAVARARSSLSRRHPGAAWDDICADVSAVMGKFLASSAAEKLAGCEILGREIPFVFPHQGKVVRGSIDLLCRDKGGLWVVDYKTDARRRKAPKVSPYRRQGAAYVAAVRRAWGERAGFMLIHLRDGLIEEIPLDSGGSTP